MTAKGSTGLTQVERSAESSRRLMAAAIELIAEKGFERTTAVEIGERAGYSRNMVRARYGSKEALLESLLDTEFQPLFLTPPGEGASGIDAALARIDHLAAAAEAKPDHTRALFTLIFEAVGPIESLGPWLRAWLGDYCAGAAEALRLGQKDGSVRADLDPDVEADRIMNYGLGLAFRWTLEPEKVDFARSLREWTAYMRGIFRPPQTNGQTRRQVKPAKVG
jgi:AcrR family transcriptional regulator